MRGGAFIKRFFPFVFTFVIGILVTSLFVNISMPRFGRGDRCERKRESARALAEYSRLIDENERLRAENEQLRTERMRVEAVPGLTLSDTPGAVPPPPAPVVPVRPSALRHGR
ncbi:MAG: hypothetical protein KF736_12145 [Acidobacteria bacterium]|nr:hypothetical protein [Acidobacteriota bacterium]MCW5948824.1 hypothetical protein [Pyrinomonadaceae bacterium]